MNYADMYLYWSRFFLFLCFPRPLPKTQFAERYKLLLKTRRENVWPSINFPLFVCGRTCPSLPRTNRTAAMHSVYAVCRLFAMFPPGIILLAFHRIPLVRYPIACLPPTSSIQYFHFTFWTGKVNIQDFVILNFLLCPSWESLKKLQ